MAGFHFRMTQIDMGKALEPPLPGAMNGWIGRIQVVLHDFRIMNIPMVFLSNQPTADTHRPPRPEHRHSAQTADFVSLRLMPQADEAVPQNAFYGANGTTWMDNMLSLRWLWRQRHLRYSSRCGQGAVSPWSYAVDCHQPCDTCLPNLQHKAAIHEFAP